MNEQRIPPRPVASKIIARILNPINAFFDWLYHSEYNPFYRSGTLAIGLLLVLIATGTYLLFFYSVSQPYDSMVVIQNQVYFGRWIRALHRYSTDACLIAVVFHILQLLSQGKTWGPRTLAWVSGVILTLALCVSAWTGYVMVWDQQGQLIALAGLELIRAVPFLGEGVSQAFSGEKALPASFFFMNLFLHVAIPLGMFFGLWIHTARLARTKWFPHRQIFFYTLLGLFILSLLIPATLLPEANLLNVVGRIPADWLYGFWIPFLNEKTALVVLVFFLAFFLLTSSIPWWWKPSKSIEPPISEVDVEGCTGCTQCALDCPYGAITMVQHPNGKHLLAEISNIHCVSCGICTASCNDLAVGPPGRNSNDQLNRIEEFSRDKLASTSTDSVVVIGCTHNDGVPSYLEKLISDEKGVFYFGINCCGTLHHLSIEKLLEKADGVILVGCAARNCVNRDGLDLLTGRLYGKRVPFLSRDIDQKKIVVSSHSELEKEEISTKIENLKLYLNDKVADVKSNTTPSSKLGWYFKRTIASTVLIFGVGYFSQAPLGKDPEFGRLRVFSRLPSQVKLDCRVPTKEELANLPIHMRKKEICVNENINYKLQVKINNKLVVEENISPRSVRGDAPTLINKDIDILPGSHLVEVLVSHLEKTSDKVLYSFKEELLIEKGIIKLISPN